MANEVKIRQYLSVIKRAVSLIENELDGKESSNEFSAPVLPQSIPQSPNENYRTARKEHIKSLMSIDCWPLATDVQYCRKPSSEDQMRRANAALDLLFAADSLEGHHFLDFGCGDGWVAQEVKKRGVASSTGFDIKYSSEWKNRTGILMTGDIYELKKQHYDIILLLDVLDHCEDPVLVMNQVKELAAPNCMICVRCHPWTSRHATHLFRQGINKAYFHLFLTYEEIAELIQDQPIFTRAEKSPLEAYRYWLRDFNIKKEQFTKEIVSDFFYVPAFKELLANEQKIEHQKINEFLQNMEIQFVTFELYLK